MRSRIRTSTPVTSAVPTTIPPHTSPDTPVDGPPAFAPRVEAPSERPSLAPPMPADKTDHQPDQTEPAKPRPFGLAPLQMLLGLAALLLAAAILSPLVLGSDDRAADRPSIGDAIVQRSVPGDESQPPAPEADDVDAAKIAWASGISTAHEDIRLAADAVLATTGEVYAAPTERREVECARLATQMGEFNSALRGTGSLDAAWGLALGESADWLGQASAACGTTRDRSAGRYVNSAQRALARADERIAELDRLRLATPAR